MPKFDVFDIVTRWDPDERPVHCSNCRHAIVFGLPDDPRVTCAKGYGSPSLSLWQIARMQRPACFKAASQCPAFDSMGSSTDLPKRERVVS